MFIFVSPLPVIMAYFVLPKSSCIEWKIGNFHTFLLLQISQYVLKILYDKASKIKVRFSNKTCKSESETCISKGADASPQPKQTNLYW